MDELPTLEQIPDRKNDSSSGAPDTAYGDRAEGRGRTNGAVSTHFWCSSVKFGVQ